MSDEYHDLRNEMDARLSEAGSELRAQREVISGMKADISAITIGQKNISDQLSTIASRLNTPNHFNWWAFIGSGVAVLGLVGAYMNVLLNPIIEKIDYLHRETKEVELRLYDNAMRLREIETVHKYGDKIQ